MATRRRPTQRRGGPLSRERVLRAALELADQGGLEAVTMQNVGQRLGVQAMSLYRHVENKDDVLDGLVDLILSEIDLPPNGAHWKQALRQRSISARQVFARHRWAIGLVESRTRLRAATLRHHEWVLAALLEAGFSSFMAGHAYTLLDSYIYGFALQEVSLTFDTPEERAEAGRVMLQQMPADKYPSMLQVATAFLESGADYATEFELGLEVILDGIERLRTGG